MFVLIAGGIVLVLFNLYLIFPWFQGDYSQYLNSIAISYITMARFLKQWSVWSIKFPFWQGWNPLWYLGYPLFLLYTPLLPFLEFIINLGLGLPLTRIYQFLTGIAFAFVPLALVIFIWSLTGKKLIAGIGGVLFTLLPSLNYFFIPEVAQVAQGLGKNPWRLIILSLYGEGPHTLGQIFLLFAGAIYYQALVKKERYWLYLSSIFIALTALTNAIALEALALLLFVITLVFLIYRPTKIFLFKRILLIALLSYGLIAFWYHPDFLFNFFREGSGVGGNYLALFPWGAVLLIILASMWFYFLSFVHNIAFSIVVTWFLLNFLIVTAHYFRRIDYLPQALRLMVEVDLSFAALAAIVLSLFWHYLEEKASTIAARLGKIGLIILLLGFSLYGLKNLGFFVRPYFHPVTWQITLTQSRTKLQQSREAEIALWLKKRVKEDERVFLSGNYAFWFNFFTAQPQVRGALDQAIVHPWIRHAAYQITAGDDGFISLIWAKIMNVRYIVVPTVASAEPFKDFRYPDKFEPFLPKVYQKKGDWIYKVPLKNPGLAQVVDLEAIKLLSPPRNAIDKVALEKYLSWLEAGRGVEWQQIAPNRYRLKGKLKDNKEGILIQQSYFPGWRLESNSVEIVKKGLITMDPLGFILIRGLSKGEFEFDLVYTGSRSQKLGLVISFLAILFLVQQGLVYFRIRLRREKQNEAS